MSGQSLTRSQVEDVIAFSEGLCYADNSFYSPFLSNELLKSLNNNSRIPNTDIIKKALSDYKNSGEDLRGFTEFANNFDILFKRTLYSYVNALSFDYKAYCENAYTEAEQQSPEFLEDKKKLAEFEANFHIKQEFYKVALNVMRLGRYFTWFRKTKWGSKGQVKYALQIMPQSEEWVIPTGYFDSGILCSMNMMYFLGQVGVDIDGYDPSLKKTLCRVMNDNDVTYKPSAQLNDRKGVYALWADVSPNDGAWMWAFNPTDFTEVPFLAPLLKDIIRDEEIATLQFNKDMIAAYAILAGEIRLFDNAKSGTKSDQFSISPPVLGAFMSKAKSGLNSAIKLAALPTENTNFFQYNDSNPNMYSNQLSTVSGLGTAASRVIYSSDRASSAEIEAQLNETYQIMKPLYGQFENFLNFYTKRHLKLHFDWRYSLDGSNYPFERKQRFENLLKLADRGVVLAPADWANAIGMEPRLFESSLRESKWGGWSNLFQLMLNTNTSKDGGSGGAPRKDATDLTESGEMSREGLED